MAIFVVSGSYPQGCSSFSRISPNIALEESGIKDDSGMQDVQYTEVRQFANKLNILQFDVASSDQEYSLSTRNFIYLHILHTHVCIFFHVCVSVCVWRKKDRENEEGRRNWKINFHTHTLTFHFDYLYVSIPYSEITIRKKSMLLDFW